MSFAKIAIQTILVICMVIAVIFGIIDIVRLAGDLGQVGIEVVEEGQVALDGMKVWHEHLMNLTMSGIGLAVTFIGWKEAQEYYDEDKDVKIYKGR